MPTSRRSTYQQKRQVKSKGTYEECEHGGDPFACPVCNEKLLSQMAHKVGVVFTARRKSKCPECEVVIVPSDEVRKVDSITHCRSCADFMERMVL